MSEGTDYCYVRNEKNKEKRVCEPKPNPDAAPAGENHQQLLVQSLRKERRIWLGWSMMTLNN